MYPPAEHNEQFIKDYQRYCCSGFRVQPDKIVSQVEDALSKLISKEVLPETNMNVFVSERKGVNLFHLFFDKILSKHYVSYVKVYSSSPIFRVKSKKVTNCDKSILLTDAVGTGAEVSKTINELERLGTPIFKVCGYVAQENTIKRIEKERGIKFEFVRVVKNETEYRKYMFCELVPYSHFKIEPLDLEHPFDIYSTKPKIEQAEIRKLLFETCNKLFQNIEFEEKDLEDDCVVIYNVEIKEPQVLIPNLIKSDKEFFMANRLLLSFKFHKSESKFRVMSCCPLEVEFNKIENREIDCNKILSGKYCEKYNYKIPYSTKCPLCIDHDISLKLLDMFMDEVHKNDTYTFSLQRKHRYI